MEAAENEFVFPADAPHCEVRTTVLEISGLPSSPDHSVRTKLLELLINCSHIDNIANVRLEHRLIDKDLTKVFWMTKHWSEANVTGISFRRFVPFRGLPECALTPRGDQCKKHFESQLGDLTKEIRLSVLHDENPFKWNSYDSRLFKPAQLYFLALRLIALIYSTSDLDISNLSSWTSAVYEKIYEKTKYGILNRYVQLNIDPKAAMEICIEFKLVGLDLSKLKSFAQEFLDSQTSDDRLSYKGIPIFLEHMGKRFTFEEAVSYVLIKTLFAIDLNQNQCAFLTAYKYLRFYAPDLEFLIPALRRTQSGLEITEDEDIWKTRFRQRLPRP